MGFIGLYLVVCVCVCVTVGLFLFICVCSRVAFKMAAAAEEEDDEEEDGQGGLLVDLEDKDVKREQETNLWFSKVGVKGRPSGSLSPGSLGFPQT